MDENELLVFPNFDLSYLVLSEYRRKQSKFTYCSVYLYFLSLSKEMMDTEEESLREG